MNVPSVPRFSCPQVFQVFRFSDSRLTADGQTFRQSLQKAITDFDGEALGDFISGNIGAAVEGAAKAEEEDPIF